ncbi:MAG: phosphoribosyltransferase family protein, partial [Actinomycetota bacterium]
ETFREEYVLEYGSAVLEIHTDDVPRGARVLVLDDILATGGTLGATAQLLHRAGLHVAGFGLIMELTDLRGRSQLGGHRVRALYRV